MVTLVAPHVTDPDLRSAIARRLTSRTGPQPFWGTGVFHLDPVDRTLAMLTNNKLDREVPLSAAVHVADRQRTLLWQVVTQLDLAKSTGNNKLRRQAHELATTQALNELVEHHTSGSGALH